MPAICPPYQVGDSCLKVNRVVLLSRLECLKMSLKTVIVTFLPAVFGVGPLGLEKALDQMIQWSKGGTIQGQQVGSSDPQQDWPSVGCWLF